MFFWISAQKKKEKNVIGPKKDNTFDLYRLTIHLISKKKTNTSAQKKKHIDFYILAKTGLFDEAIIAYDKVIEYDEENEEIWLDKAEVITDYENIENGIITLYKGLEKQPENNLIYARLVAYLLMNGKVNEAIENLTILLTNDKELLSELTSYYPEAISFQKVIDTIENFKD